MSTKQDAATRPTPTLLRKAAIASGGTEDHAGEVLIKPIANFDLDRTIFRTLEGAAARFVITKRLAKEPHWTADAAKRVEADYEALQGDKTLPKVDAELLKFMVDECDFDVEHADGSFLDHLYFCFEYGVHHYPEQSPLVLLLHSILGTGTNTFAMTADKIPGLRALLNDFDWRHIEAFPSALRLLYDFPLRKELHQNINRLTSLESIRMHRVIDNEPVTMSGEDFWIQMNYQLIHLLDFLPVANWGTHKNDTSFILFRDLYELLDRGGMLQAKVCYQPKDRPRSLTGERPDVGGLLTTFIPVKVSEKLAARSVQKFSERIGHSLDFELTWR